MHVSRSGYYKYFHVLPAGTKHQKDKLLVEVKALSQESDSSYGSRRISKGLRAKGYAVGRYATRRLMREAGISCKQRRRYRIVATQSKHSFAVAENVLNREFTVSDPNRVWLTYITYLWTLEGWLYVIELEIFDIF